MTVWYSQRENTVLISYCFRTKYYFQAEESGPLMSLAEALKNYGAIIIIGEL